MIDLDRQMNCVEHIEQACNAISLPLKSVKRLFYGKEIYEINFSREEEKDFMLEIQFDAISLCCLFDDKDICDGVYLFLDDWTDIVYYMYYCNGSFSYDMRLNCWIVNGCLIHVVTGGMECSMLVLPIKA